MDETDKLDVVKKFSLDVSWVFLSSTITLIIGFLIRPLLARWLGPEGLGLYSMIFTIYSIFLIFGCFGLPEALVKYISQHKSESKKLSQIASCGAITSLIFGGVVGFILYFLSGYIADFFDMSKLEDLIKILVFVFPSAAFLHVQIGILNGLRVMKRYTILAVSQQILLFFFILSFLAFGFGIKGVVMGILLSSFVTVIIGLILLKKYIKLDLGEFFLNLKKLVPFGGKLAAANSVNTINNRLDVIIIGFFLMASDVGYYSVALTLSKFFWFIPIGIQKITYPVTSEYWNKNEYVMLQKILNKVMKISTLILLLCGLVIVFFHEDIISLLFGKGFLYASSPLLILLFGTIIRGSLCQSIGGSLSAINRPDLPLKISIFMILVNAVLNIILIPKFGIIGAAVATTTSLIVGTILFLWLTVKKLSLKIDIKWYVGICVIILTIITVFYYMNLVMSGYLIGGLLLGLFIVLVYFFFIGDEEKTLFIPIFRSLLQWRH